eukprot:Filipodium_phascolosomae@DN5290_c0_g1_i1.p1
MTASAAVLDVWDGYVALHHKAKVSHNDCKPANIVFGPPSDQHSARGVIIDYGWASVGPLPAPGDATGVVTADLETIKTFRDSYSAAFYLPPELLGQLRNQQKFDDYSFTTLTVENLEGEYITSEKDKLQFRWKADMSVIDNPDSFAWATSVVEMMLPNASLEVFLWIRCMGAINDPNKPYITYEEKNLATSTAGAVPCASFSKQNIIRYKLQSDIVSGDALNEVR